MSTHHVPQMPANIVVVVVTQESGESSRLDRLVANTKVLLARHVWRRTMASAKTQGHTIATPSRKTAQLQTD